MSQQNDTALAMQLADGRTITAQPRPEDQDRLTRLLAGRQWVKLGEAAGDTQGHAMSNDVTVDVEGHALTLRLPNPADAAALRRAVAMGAVTATIVAAGAFAAMQGAPAQPQAVNPALNPAAPVTQPAQPRQSLAELREARLGEMESYPAGAAPAPVSEAENSVGNPTGSQRRSGPLE